jgi:hypothetical protein
MTAIPKVAKNLQGTYQLWPPGGNYVSAMYPILPEWLILGNLAFCGIDNIHSFNRWRWRCSESKPLHLAFPRLAEPTFTDSDVNERQEPFGSLKAQIVAGLVVWC